MHLKVVGFNVRTVFTKFQGHYIKDQRSLALTSTAMAKFLKNRQLLLYAYASETCKDLMLGLSSQSFKVIGSRSKAFGM